MIDDAQGMWINLQTNYNFRNLILPVTGERRNPKT